eukprot:TRINITY_DN19387_c0_g1_i1.p1 TRINITY_DN19387_c0_g1~~TRINITY_DN19387_c0_g1_i1.p1  ORF type:complete len:233 (+),score=38.26 TRINITY_DN19387_c0_g1_i1:93-791(+)
MKTQWQHFPNTGFSARKPAESSDLYLTRHQIQSYCVANGYDAAVLRGQQCDFYKGDGRKLFKEAKSQNGHQLFINFCDAISTIDEEWIMVDRLDIPEDESLSLGRTASDIDSSCDLWDDDDVLPINNSIGPNSNIVAVYEHQRRLPLLGWSAPLKRPRWTNAFTDSPSPALTKVKPPAGTRWSTEWEVDRAHGDLDDGWEYSSKRIGAYVHKARRRKWIRKHTPAAGTTINV